MLDTAIVGGGLCGVVLARSLYRQGRAVALFEARDRLGGRILSVAGNGSGMAMDLGPTWFWPDTQPLMKSLVAELGLVSIPQHDDGSHLHLNDPDKAPDRVEGKAHYVAYLRKVLTNLSGHRLTVQRISHVHTRLCYVELTEEFEIGGAPAEWPECILFERDDDGLIARVSVFFKQPGAQRR